MAANQGGEALEWGNGDRLVEVFLEPTCPFSVKAFNKLADFVEQAGEDKVRVRIWLHSQPWHMFSGVITRAVLAASTLENGKQQALQLLAAIGQHREAFEFDDHATGPNRDATPNDILKRLVKVSGVDMLKAFDAPELQQLARRHTKYARQNGIHVSPTFMVDGLVDSSMGSGDSVAEWVEKVGA
ncbi:DsbA family protein [Carnimonas bestiolae]|uniref:DsbA family protein n=1 Tax=Carnimonas bestiolae TaxID=3402172 RepID=UPI003EDB79AF